MITTLHNGRIVLINGDCLTWLPKVKQLASLIIADPPYFKITQEDWDHQWRSPEEYIAWCIRWFDLCSAIMLDTASFYMWQSVGTKQQVLFDLAIVLRDRFVFQAWITWKKSRGRGNRRGWLFTREECLWYTKTKDYIWNDAAQYDLSAPTNRKDLGFNGKPRKSQYKRFTNIWECNEDQNYGADRIRTHYTPKPLVFIERIVNAHTTSPDDIVIDPFLGSGTTGVACVKLHRRFIGIEKDPQSYQAAVERITGALNDQKD